MSNHRRPTNLDLTRTFANDQAEAAGWEGRVNHTFRDFGDPTVEWSSGQLLPSLMGPVAGFLLDISAADDGCPPLCPHAATASRRIWWPQLQPMRVECQACHEATVKKWMRDILAGTREPRCVQCGDLLGRHQLLSLTRDGIIHQCLACEACVTDAAKKAGVW